MSVPGPFPAYVPAQSDNSPGPQDSLQPSYSEELLLCVPQGVWGRWVSFRDKTRQPQKRPSSPYLTFPVRGGIFERQSEIVIQLADN